jgi:outer membrane protein assembly factor BamD (BamD/ComL family)
MKSNRPLTLAVLLLAIAPALAQEKKDAPPPTADLIRDAEAARKRGDITRAASIFTAAQKAKDFGTAKPPVELILAVGDYHFAQSSLESQEQALAVYDLAMTVYGKSLSPFDTAQVRARRSEVLSWQGKMDLARDEINTLRTQYKDDRRVNLLADLASANLLLLSNQSQAARDALVPLVEINDSIITPAAMFAMGRAYVQLKQPEDAVNTFRSLWNRYGESDFVKRAVYLIGQVYFDRGDFLEARKLYEACAVVGAAMQTSVRVGDELVIKVADPDYYARTRSTLLPATITVPSGDRETVRLEKNQVSDQLYIGRIQTALLLPKPDDDQLQVGGDDVISIAYSGQTGKPYEVRVVDDGSIQIGFSGSGLSVTGSVASG